MEITWEDYEKVGLKVGTIIEIEDFPKARIPAYKMKIDFGEFGVKSSSAQVTTFYTKEDLMGTQVICVTNFPTKRIAGFKSEVLTLGLITKEGIVLVHPERKVQNGLDLL
ncbi:MAG: tRNA-binding protein [Candidatus Altiarchaeota archaeon]|nr:tRNA-binding protein [Candidatus Altiarchaeota archaeon]